MCGDFMVGLDSRGLGEFQMLLLEASNQQLRGLLKLCECELLKRQMFDQAELNEEYEV